jgi:hypothetical protein
MQKVTTYYVTMEGARTMVAEPFAMVVMYIGWCLGVTAGLLYS